MYSLILPNDSLTIADNAEQILYRWGVCVKLAPPHLLAPSLRYRLLPNESNVLPIPP